MGYRASGCSCCLRWEYRLVLCVCVAAADAWNGTQVAGRASGLRCIFRQVITLLHWFFFLLHWSEKITGKRVRQRDGMGGGGLSDLVAKFNDWEQNLRSLLHSQVVFGNPYRWRPNLSYPNMLRCRKMKLYLINASPSHGLGRRLHLLHIIVSFFHSLICVDLTALRKYIHEFLKCLFYFHLAVHLWDSTSSPGI